MLGKACSPHAEHSIDSREPYINMEAELKGSIAPAAADPGCQLRGMAARQLPWR